MRITGVKPLHKTTLKQITILNALLASVLIFDAVTTGLTYDSAVWVTTVSAILLVSSTYAAIIIFGKGPKKALHIYLTYINTACALLSLYAFVITL